MSFALSSSTVLPKIDKAAQTVVCAANRNEDNNAAYVFAVLFSESITIDTAHIHRFVLLFVGNMLERFGIFNPKTEY